MDPPPMQPPNPPGLVAPDVAGAKVATGRPISRSHHLSDDEEDTCAEDQSSQSSTRRRCAVRKVPISRAAPQEPNSSDDFVKSKSRDIRTKKAGAKPPQVPPRTRMKETQQPIKDEKKKKTYATIRCAPGSIFNILSVMSQPMKDELTWLGFKDFLSFSLDKLDDRLLAIFLMDHIEVQPLRIVINGTELPITPLIVKYVLGLPNGTKPLDVVSASDKAVYQKELRQECEKKGMKNIVSEKHKKNSKIRRFEDLKPTEVPRYVIEEFARTGNGDDWSIKCFFMTLLDGLLFSTSALFVPGEIYYYCKNIEDVAKYDLCSAIVNDLTQKAIKWKKNDPSERSGASSVQGCVALIMLYYLDNLHCPAHMIEDAKSTPRASFFNSNIVDKIAKADMKHAADGTTITFGNLGFHNKAGSCYEDVRVGDLPSPDAPPPEPARRKRQRSDVADVGAMPSAATTAPVKRHPTAPAKRPRPTSKPTSAAPNNLDDSSLHLLPRFVGIISRIEDEKLQAEARVALQDHDSRMDAAMKLVEDGKRLVSEGERIIKDTHQNVVAALTRLFGDAYDLGSPRDNRARRRSATKSGSILFRAGSSGSMPEDATDTLSTGTRDNVVDPTDAVRVELSPKPTNDGANTVDDADMSSKQIDAEVDPKSIDDCTIPPKFFRMQQIQEVILSIPPMQCVLSKAPSLPMMAQTLLMMLT